MNHNKILHITGAMNIGGTETMLINLYRELNTKIIFHFISYSDKEAYYDEEIKILGGKVIRLKPPREVGVIGAVKDIRRVIKENGPYNAVHTHMLFNCGVSMIAAYISGVKIRVAHAHTTSDNINSILRKIYVSIMRLGIKIFATDYLACSDGAAKYLFGNKITSKKRYKMLPNYIDYEKFIKCEDKNNIRKELGIKEDDVVVGHIGRFITAKNHDFLIEIVSEMIKINSKVKLILVGIGDLKEQIEVKVENLGIDSNVYFLSVRKDIPNILSNIDIFILPSIYEGLGLVLLEAQTSNIPCLVSQAVQPEVDLGIGLLNKLQLSDGSKLWAEVAINIINQNPAGNVDVMKMVKKKNYDLDSILNKLLSVYKLKLE